MKEKITIGIFNDSFYPMADGVIMVVDNYARILSKYANVIVFVPKYFMQDYDDSILPYKVVRCQSIKPLFIDYSLPLPKLDRRFQKELDSYKLDVVHIHSPFTLGLAGLNYAKKHKIPCVATMHSQFKQDFQRAVKSERVANRLTHQIIKIFNKCDLCLAVNSEVARIYYEDYHYKKMPLVMNNATEMKPVEDIKKARKYINDKYRLKDNCKVFVFVGRINALKNIFFIADALAYLKTLNPNFKYKMLFVGSGQDELRLKLHIMELGIKDDVIMCGKVTDREKLANYYARSDLMLFPSIYDASSIVQIEAASQKTPTLFLEGTATSATVTNNVNGYIAKNDVHEYAKKIIEIMNDKNYKNVCENAYRDLYRTWEDAVGETYQMYLDLIKRR